MTAPTSSRTGSLMAEIRRMPLFRQVVPMESGIGWPIPVRHRPWRNGDPAVYLKLPLFGFQRPRDVGRETQVYPPFALITLEWRTGRPVEYADLRYTRPWPVPDRPEPVGEFPHDAVRGMTTGQYLAARDRLLALYDELFAGLGGDGSFAGAVEFAELFGRLVEPSLLPYYRTLGGRFVERFLGAGPSAADG